MKESTLYQIVTKISIRFGTRYTSYILRATSVSHAKKVVKTCPYYGTIKEGDNFIPTNERIHDVFEFNPELPNYNFKISQELLDSVKNVGDVCLSDIDDLEYLKYPRS